MLTIVFDGIAYGMLLFVLAVGLAVTLGLMNFINLAHGAFAMAGGYLTALAMQKAGVPFLACLALAFVAVGLLGALLEWTLYRRVYGKPHLDQVLFSIGLAFMSVAGVDFFLGSSQLNVTLPGWLSGRSVIGAGALQLGMGHYRIFIIVLCALLTVVLQLVLARTRFGSWLRAAVDDPRVAAGLGGALSVGILGVDPGFPLKYMIYFLIVVSVGGTASITGPLAAALLLGIADVAGKYFIPKMGPFTVYLIMIVILMWRPQGLFARKGGR
jgi:branched-chain amino acid transport system permease protein